MRLVLWNIGGGFPGEPCKTTQGHPGYYSFCVAEDPETNPWEPLQVERGFGADDTIVTIAAVEGPRLIGNGAGYGPAEDVLYVLADSIAALGSPQISGGDMVLVLAPMAAKNLADAGYSKLDLKRELARLATRPVREVRHRRSIAETHPLHWNKLANPNDDDAREFQVSLQGSQKTYIKTLKPERDHDRDMLMVEESMWAYVPNLKRALRVNRDGTEFEVLADRP